MMGGAGFMAYAKEANKKNLELLRNKRSNTKKPYQFDFKYRKSFKFKKYTLKHKNRIQNQFRRERRKNLIVSIFLLLFSFGVVLTTIYFLFIH